MFTNTSTRTTPVLTPTALETKSIKLSLLLRLGFAQTSVKPFSPKREAAVVTLRAYNVSDRSTASSRFPLQGRCINPNTDVCEALDFINTNSDVYLGYLGWAAGAFSPSSYVLSLTPMSGNTDQPLMKQCFAAKFSGGGGAAPGPAPGPSSYPASSAPASSYPASSAPAPSAPASSMPASSAPASSTTTDSSTAAAPPIGSPIQPKIPISSGVLPPSRSSSTDAAPYPTPSGFQPPVSPYGSSVPTTLSTRVKPTSTEEARPEETGNGEPDDETCEA